MKLLTLTLFVSALTMTSIFAKDSSEAKVYSYNSMIHLELSDPAEKIVLKQLFSILDHPTPNLLEEVKAFFDTHNVPVDALYQVQTWPGVNETPMLHTLKMKEYDVFYYLYEKYGNPNVNTFRDDGNGWRAEASLYTYGLEYGDWRVVSFLKSHGGDWSKNRIYRACIGSELMEAAEFNSDLEVTVQLIQSGADVNALNGVCKESILEKAATNPNIEISKALISAGARVTNQALIIASFRNVPELVQILIKNGADANAASDLNGEAPLGAMSRNTEENIVGIANILIRAGANVNSTTTSKVTPLMSLVVHGHGVEGLNILLSAGAHVNAVDIHGGTALMYAAGANPHAEVTEALIRFGAKINAHDQWHHSALWYAQNKNHNPEIAQILIRAGAK